MRPATREGFTIAIICALTLEADAVEAHFDETYDRLSVRYRKQPGDDNAYVNGRIGAHNVVICYMPEMGKKSAASAISSMRVSYSRIEVALLIGICGGAPYPSTNEELFLGDVIISDAVIEYDFGRRYPGGFQRKTGVKDTIGRPHREIRSLLAGLKARRSRAEFQGKMLGYLHAVQELDAQWRRPSDVADILFEADYQHKHHGPSSSNCVCWSGSSRDDICDDALGTACSSLGCEENEIKRQRYLTEEESPTIHIGTIASADTVLKSAEHRDSLVKAENVIGFEMEGAGVWDNISCLIIKGVCDYADSHKNKSWQAYAAATGASAAKALLEYWVTIEESKPDIKGSWMVPLLRNPAFVGREDEITKIEGMMEGAFKVAICGLGGIGKTQIALELAHRMRDRDSSCSVFWIPCTGLESIEQAYMSLAQTIGIPGVKPSEVKERVKVYLDQVNGSRWRMIFDNVDDLDMPAILKEFLPRNQQGRLVFTTRNRAVAVKLASQHLITISEPDPETGLRILEESLVDRPIDNSDAQVLLERLTLLPLAIIQAAAYMNENQISISTYIDLLGQQESSMIQLLSEEFEDEHRYQNSQNAVATTWWISFQQIQRFNELAADYLGFIACINPRDIPKWILPPSESENARIKALGILKAYTFISEQAGGDYLSIHRLVYLATRNWLKQNQTFNLQVLKNADHLTKIFPGTEHRSRKQWREYLPHTLALMEESEFQAQRERSIPLIGRVGECLSRDGRYKEAERLYQQAMETQKQELGPRHPETLAWMSNIAETYVRQGRWEEAHQVWVQVIQAQKAVLEPGHPDILRSMYNVALIHWRQGRLKEAESLGVQVMETRQQIMGLDHNDTIRSMASVAVVYLAQGRLAEAAFLALQVIGLQKQTLGSEHPATLNSMRFLVTIYGQQGRLEQAEELGLQVLNSIEQTMGPEHPDTLASMGILANVYKMQGRLNEAEELGLQVMENSKRVLGPEHPDTLGRMNRHVSLCLDQGRLQEAEDLGLQVMENSKRVLGPEHFETLMSLDNLAHIYANQERLEEAEDLGLRVIEISKRVLGPNNPDTLHREDWLRLLQQLKQELGLGVIELSKRLPGPEHPDTL